MDNLAKQPDSEREVVFTETAERRDLMNIVIEKDFWVCWTLKRLFTHPDLVPVLTFKGGTSLSKAYDLIERFSEDIDLTISRIASVLQDVPNVMEDDISGKERKRRLESLKQAAQKFIKDNAFPALQGVIESELGQSESWQLVLDDKDPDLQTILFYYPKVFDYGGEYGQRFHGEGSGYIRPHIKLEFGARGDIEPQEKRPIIINYQAALYELIYLLFKCKRRLQIAFRHLPTDFRQKKAAKVSLPWIGVAAMLNIEILHYQSKCKLFLKH